MSLHRVVMFEGGWGVFYYIRFLLERGDPPLPLPSGILCNVHSTRSHATYVIRDTLADLLVPAIFHNLS